MDKWQALKDYLKEQIEYHNLPAPNGEIDVVDVYIIKSLRHTLAVVKKLEKEDKNG